MYNNGNGTKNLKFYTVVWSKSCQEAEKFLNAQGIEFNKIEFNNIEEITSTTWNLGVNKLPVLIGGGNIYEGLESIKSYIREL